MLQLVEKCYVLCKFYLNGHQKCKTKPDNFLSEVISKYKSVFLIVNQISLGPSLKVKMIFNGQVGFPLLPITFDCMHTCFGSHIINCKLA